MNIVLYPKTDENNRYVLSSTSQVFPRKMWRGSVGGVHN